MPVPTSADQVYPYFLAKLQEHGMQQCNVAPTRAANVLALVISNISDQLSNVALLSLFSTSDNDALCFNIEVPVYNYQYRRQCQ